jgi:hypothetical protein
MKLLGIVLLLLCGAVARAQVLTTFNYGVLESSIASTTTFTSVSLILLPNTNQTLVLNNFAANGITLNGSTVGFVTDGLNNGTMTVRVSSLLRIRDGIPAITNQQYIEAQYLIKAGAVESIGSMFSIGTLPSEFDMSNVSETKSGSYTSSGQTGQYTSIANHDKVMYQQTFERAGVVKKFSLVSDITSVQIPEPRYAEIMALSLLLLTTRRMRVSK